MSTLVRGNRGGRTASQEVSKIKKEIKAGSMLVSPKGYGYILDKSGRRMAHKQSNKKPAFLDNQPTKGALCAFPKE